MSALTIILMSLVLWLQAGQSEVSGSQLTEAFSDHLPLVALPRRNDNVAGAWRRTRAAWKQGPYHFRYPFNSYRNGGDKYDVAMTQELERQKRQKGEVDPWTTKEGLPRKDGSGEDMHESDTSAKLNLGKCGCTNKYTIVPPSFIPALELANDNKHHTRRY